MGRRNRPTYRRGDAAPPPPPSTGRWWVTPALLLLTIVLFSLAFAPFKQFYLAWVALVPWLIVVRRCRSAWTAWWWSWLGGIGFFLANMWWLVYVTGPGMVALMIVLGLYWAAAGAILRATNLLEPETPRQAVASVFLVAALWTALEWFRGTWPLHGLPWLYVGHTQSPALVLCQIADITGVFGITFCAVAVNAWIALWLRARMDFRRVAAPGIAVLGLTIVVLTYGMFRLNQHTTLPGPRVLVVQSNYPQSNSGAKGADQDEIIDFHLHATAEALSHDPQVNLAVWSETMMPSLNASSRRFAAEHGLDAPWQSAYDRIRDLAMRDHVAVLTGGYYADDWGIKGRYYVAADRRNSAYLFTSDGRADQRYDKVHLVPFGEYLPFRSGFPPLYRLFLALSPYPEEYALTPGANDALTVFQLGPDWRFVTPICFEDIDGPFVRRMFAPEHGSRKRADFIVNITNDGWFRYNEMPQHLQAAVFRSIENRAPTARSVNTGISGFIDSTGHVFDRIPAGREGTSAATLPLDSRTTFYTRFGDVFVWLCDVAAVALLAFAITRAIRRRRLRAVAAGS